MKINLLDLTGTIAILLSLYLVTSNYEWWILYAIGCLIWVYIHFTKKLYFGMVMNFIAGTIAICNLFKEII